MAWHKCMLVQVDKWNFNSTQCQSSFLKKMAKLWYYILASRPQFPGCFSIFALISLSCFRERYNSPCRCSALALEDATFYLYWITVEAVLYNGWGDKMQSRSSPQIHALSTLVEQWLVCSVANSKVASSILAAMAAFPVEAYVLCNVNVH